MSPRAGEQRRKHWFVGVVRSTTLVLSLCLASLAGATNYYTVDFPGATFTDVNGGPNPRGEVVGTYGDTANTTHGFLLSNDGKFTTIDYPGAANTSINGWVNPQGDIVGQYTDSQQVTHGFLLRNGTFSTVDYPGATSTKLGGINAAGEILGSYCKGTQCSVFTLDHGTFTDVTIPNGIVKIGAMVTEDGTLVTGCLIDAKNHVCLIAHGQTTVLDYPGAIATGPGAATSDNQLVGAWADAQMRVHGFLYAHGEFTSLDVPGATYTYAGGINPAGEIVGQFVDANGKEHGFILQPDRRHQDHHDNRRNDSGSDAL